ncbi:R-linalool synthase QH5, chloroplastic [Artemisia annua]|uniref:R-linalool synthase QH5, chloroplastic n=1 Tax=Artemisia annua TaxID=35608 RepID=A0A2U1KAD6_ARTAN|nr:R-linalool synthase QH5, chloroplastic [Artemisia annua]
MASISLFPYSVVQQISPLARDNAYKRIYSSKTTRITVNAAESHVRRSANYEPSSWSFDHIQSLSSKYTGDDYVARANTLKDAVKTMIRKAGNLLRTLELVDELQRLGISYLFEEEISNLLETIYYNYYEFPEKWNKTDLNLKALGFRLLRQHGYHVPQEIFLNFKDKNQNLNSYLLEDVVGMLNLYEASYHSLEDESILDDARDITTKYLKESLEKIDGSIFSLVSHALEQPLHWRVPRVESKWFIELYENRGGASPTLIELAKLDFDMDKNQNLNSYLLEDVVGMLNLYEASYHSLEDESILDDARDITTKYLKESLEKIDGSIFSLVSHALEQPLHWRVPRVESKWFIELYENRGGASPTLIELAKLDFDMVQAIHLEDLKHASRYVSYISKHNDI